MEPLLSSDEAATILKIHPKVVGRMAKRGEIPAFKVGKSWRYRESDPEACINSRAKLGSQPRRPQYAF